MNGVQWIPPTYLIKQASHVLEGDLEILLISGHAQPTGRILDNLFSIFIRKSEVFLTIEHLSIHQNAGCTTVFQ